MKYSLIIGIQKYIESENFENLNYVQNDISDFTKAIEQLGWDNLHGNENHILLDSFACKSNIEKHIGYLSGTMRADDELIVYYSGHGFGNKDANYLACYDTINEKKEETSISFQYLYNEFQETCNKVIFFMDCCHSGMIHTGVKDSNKSFINQKAFFELFNNSEHWSVLASCKPNETSWELDCYKHGVWSYHLIECLNGNVKDVLTDNYLLTINNLQKYLAYKVSDEIMNKKKQHQTPIMLNVSCGDFILYDFSEKYSKKIPSLDFEQIQFFYSESNMCKYLEAIKKLNYNPKFYTPQFVFDNSQTERQELFDDIYQQLIDSKIQINDIAFKNYPDGYTEIYSKSNNDLLIDLYLGINSEDQFYYDKDVKLSCNKELYGNEYFNKSFSDTFTGISYQLGINKDLQNLSTILTDKNIKYKYQKTKNKICIEDIKISEMDIFITTSSLVLDNINKKSLDELIQELDKVLNYFYKNNIF